MQLFDTLQPGPSDSGAGYSEPEFAYINRSGRPEAGQIRSLLEKWFRDYCPHDSELRSKLRSSNNDTHRAAVFELYLHALLTECGYEVSRHVPLSTSGRRNIDFVVRGKTEYAVAIEAVSPNFYSRIETQGHRHASPVIDVLAQLQRPGVKLGIEFGNLPERPLSLSALRSDVNRWLALDDVIERLGRVELLNELSHAASFVWRNNGWACTIRAYARSLDRSLDGPARVSYGMRTDDTVERMQKVLAKKAGKYGQIGMPYVIAINMPGFRHGESPEMQALFGRDAFVFDTGRPSAPAEFARQPDGLWHQPTGTVYSRVSGVIFVHDLSAWTIAKRNARLYLNPFGEHKNRGRLLRLSRAVPSRNKRQMLFKAGCHPRELLGLSENWPETSPLSAAA